MATMEDLLHSTGSVQGTAIETDCQEKHPVIGRGLAYLQQAKYNKAIKDFNEAIGLDPNLARGFDNRGLAYSRMGDHANAIKDFNEAIRLDPRDPVPLNNRGVT
jgi:Flp pilus assembly protein TadD